MSIHIQYVNIASWHGAIFPSKALETRTFYSKSRPPYLLCVVVFYSVRTVKIPISSKTKRAVWFLTTYGIWILCCIIHINSIRFKRCIRKPRNKLWEQGHLERIWLNFNFGGQFSVGHVTCNFVFWYFTLSGERESPDQKNKRAIQLLIFNDTRHFNIDDITNPITNLKWFQ